jgi:ribose transport system substrate-binding protein
MIKRIALGAAAALAIVALGGSNSLAAKPLNSIGISVGDLANPFFVAIGQGASDEAKKLGGPNVKITTVSSNYDLNTQVGQIENFIANKTDIILVNAVDPKAIAPVLKKATDAGIVVVAFDVAAQGADATVMSDNIAAGTTSCDYIAKHIGGKGNVVIINGPPVSSVIDRVKGCEKVFAANPGIKVLSDNQNAKGSRDGGLQVMADLLTADPKLDAVFAINDPTAIGADLAIKQAHRDDIKLITAVDGSPDGESGLKDKASLFAATAAQNPYKMASIAIEEGYGLLQGKQPAQKILLLPVPLITKANINTYAGWVKK